jgi:hypothetical protein
LNLDTPTEASERGLALEIGLESDLLPFAIDEDVADSH